MKRAIEKALNRNGLFLDYEEMEAIENEIISEHKENYNLGLFPERKEFNVREKVFSEEWQIENKIIPWMNQGRGTLQNLMINKDNTTVFYITENDRVIVATVIQWLGTNIGFSFLERTLKKCGYKLVKIDNKK